MAQSSTSATSGEPKSSAKAETLADRASRAIFPLVTSIDKIYRPGHSLFRQLRALAYYVYAQLQTVDIKSELKRNIDRAFVEVGIRIYEDTIATSTAMLRPERPVDVYAAALKQHLPIIRLLINPDNLFDLRRVEISGPYRPYKETGLGCIKSESDPLDPILIASLIKDRLEYYGVFEVLYRNLFDRALKSLTRLLAEGGIDPREAQRLAAATVDRYRSQPTTPVIAASFANEASIALAASAILAERQTRRAFAAAKAAPLPVRAPEPWTGYDPEKPETAESFLLRQYGHRLGIDGDLSMRALKAADRPLAKALEGEFAGKRRKQLLALFPTPKERSDAKLMRALGYVPEGKERQNALTVLARGERPGLRGPYKRRGPA